MSQISFNHHIGLAMHYSTSHHAKAILHLREAIDILLESEPAWTGKPEDDPSRSAADRDAWRLARGA